MTIDGILFDKDGTLIDFDATWGPAIYDVMRLMSDGDEAVFAELVRINGFVEAERRFLPDSPFIAGSSESYGPLWAETLGRPAGPDFFREMDELFNAHGLKNLAPIAEPVAVLGTLARMGISLGIATNQVTGQVIAVQPRPIGGHRVVPVTR